MDAEWERAHPTEININTDVDDVVLPYHYFCMQSHPRIFIAWLASFSSCSEKLADPRLAGTVQRRQSFQRKNRPFHHEHWWLFRLLHTDPSGWSEHKRKLPASHWYQWYPWCVLVKWKHHEYTYIGNHSHCIHGSKILILCVKDISFICKIYIKV